MATGLPQNTPIKTYWGDARQFVELHQDNKQYDLVFGDAFNDFSVPWHLTTREFNEKIKKMLTPNGVYMINIIDVYESDAHADEQGRERRSTRTMSPTRPSKHEDPRAAPWPRPIGYGGFVGAWTKTARLTFDQCLYLRNRRYVPGAGLAKPSWSSLPMRRST